MGKKTLSSLKKHRDPMKTYYNKVRKTTNKYNKTVKNRQDTDGLGRIKKELKPLEYFINMIKKPKVNE